jgi:hypothetical protein
MLLLAISLIATGTSAIITAALSAVTAVIALSIRKK